MPYTSKNTQYISSENIVPPPDATNDPSSRFCEMQATMQEIIQQYKVDRKKNNERFDKQLQELFNTKSETIRLSDNTKVLKEKTTTFSSKLIEQDKHIYSLTILF